MGAGVHSEHDDKGGKLFMLASLGDTTIIAQYVNACIEEFGVSIRIKFINDQYRVMIHSAEQIPNPRAAADLLVNGLLKMKCFAMDHLLFEAIVPGVDGSYWSDEYVFNEEWQTWQSAALKEKTELVPAWRHVLNGFKELFSRKG